MLFFNSIMYINNNFTMFSHYAFTADLRVQLWFFCVEQQNCKYSVRNLSVGVKIKYINQRKSISIFQMPERDYWHLVTDIFSETQSNLSKSIMETRLTNSNHRYRERNSCSEKSECGRSIRSTKQTWASRGIGHTGELHYSQGAGTNTFLLRSSKAGISFKVLFVK